MWTLYSPTCTATLQLKIEYTILSAFDYYVYYELTMKKYMKHFQ